jgi:V/A-type H+-transporting ATPase subunit G/H
MGFKTGSSIIDKEVFHLAAEAVLKINEAEEAGNEKIKNANTEAKDILRKADITAEEKGKEIIESARERKAAMIEASIKKAEKDCENLIQQGNAEKDSIQNMDQSKIEKAAAVVFERIVN